jgi:hypothetical protein
LSATPCHRRDRPDRVQPLLEALGPVLGRPDLPGQRLAGAFAVTAEAWGALPLALALPALAFAGAGGGQNLVQSNWMRDKGYGVGVHVPPPGLASHRGARGGPGHRHTFRENEENLAGRRGWWNVANKEQLVSFVAITIITIVLMSLLAYSTVLGAEGEDNIKELLGL